MGTVVVGNNSSPDIVCFFVVWIRRYYHHNPERYYHYDSESVYSKLDFGCCAWNSGSDSGVSTVPGGKTSHALVVGDAVGDGNNTNAAPATLGGERSQRGTRCPLSEIRPPGPVWVRARRG